MIMTPGIEDTRQATSPQSHLTHPSRTAQSATPPYCADRHRTIQKKKQEDYYLHVEINVNCHLFTGVSPAKALELYGGLTNHLS